MADCKAYEYPGWGEWARNNLHYTQAIRFPEGFPLFQFQSTLKLSKARAGGWTASNKEVEFANMIKRDLGDEIDQAFANCDYNLKYAGGKGFVQVYKVVTYSTDIKSQSEHIIRNLRKWMPGHAPIWTELGVKELGADGMHFETDVEAYDPKGATAAKK